MAQVEQVRKMIAQKDDTDDYYENMSIYPVIERRQNADPSKMYQFLKIAGFFLTLSPSEYH